MIQGAIKKQPIEKQYSPVKYSLSEGFVKFFYVSVSLNGGEIFSRRDNWVENFNYYIQLVMIYLVADLLLNCSLIKGRGTVFHRQKELVFGNSVTNVDKKLYLLAYQYTIKQRE